MVARRLKNGRFSWLRDVSTLSLTHSQLKALVLGLPWQRIGEAGVIMDVSPSITDCADGGRLSLLAPSPL